MSLFCEIAIAVLVCSAVFTAIWLAKGLLVTPVRGSSQVVLTAVVASSGEAAHLEQTVNGLLWLKRSGKIEMGVMIADAGMLPEARDTAEKLTERYDGVSLCALSDIPEAMLECGWTGTTNTYK
jgi:hypothetical protein